MQFDRKEWVVGIKLIGYIELCLVCCILVGCALLGVKKRRFLFGKEKCDGKITMNKTVAKITVFTTIAIFLFVIWCLLSISRENELERYKENLILAQFLLLFFLGSVFMFFFSVNWEVFLYNDHFVFTNWFGIKHKYFYDELRIKRLVGEAYACYRRGRRLLSVSDVQPNREILKLAINGFKGKQTYALPMKQWYIDVEALRREEREWLKTASSNDKMLYDSVIEKLKKDDFDVFMADYIGEVRDKMIYSIFEDTLLSWEDKKMQAITAYIIGNKENKKAYDIILQAYLSLSWEEKKRYASLYDKAISSTITRDALLADMEWLADWHSAFNLPGTMKKIAKGNLPGVNEIWLGILKQKNTYDREWYDLEDAKATLLSLVRR